MHARSFAIAALIGLSLVATAGASIDVTSSLRFGFVPQKAFPGQPASLSVVVRPSGVRCSASIRYADASLHRLPSVVARAGKASWRWTIPAKVKLGSASANVACGKAGRVSRSFAVVGPPSAPAKVDRHQERLLAARALHLARRQLRGRALESRRPRTTRSTSPS